MKVFTVAEMAAAEQAADAAGWSYAAMMDAAGKATADLILSRWPPADLHALILVGPGNNGGDGLVAGRYLAGAGANVTFYLLKGRDSGADEPYRQVIERNLLLIAADADAGFGRLRATLDETTLIVDALLGTGHNRPIKGPLADLMRIVAAAAEAEQSAAAPSRHSLTELTALPRQTKAVVAVDCPSGLYCDSGHLDPLTLPADVTVTFAAPKWGHFLPPGAAACGELVVAEIGIDPTLPAVANVPIELATPALIRTQLPARPSAGHKGTFGKVLVIGGSMTYRGAPVLAGLGAFRAGAGLVNLAVPQVVRATAVTLLPEASYPPLPANEILDGASADWLSGELDNYEALLLGPGIGPAGPFLDKLLRPEATLPALVVDADALNWLASQPDWPQRLPERSILTPHPGEMARLVGQPLPALLEENRITLARHWAAVWGHILLLKGAHTVIAHPDGRVVILPFANPLLAVGGSGDVLGGVIVALLGQGLSPWAAAQAGGYLHGAAAELARPEFGAAGLLAREIAERVPAARRLMSFP